MQPEVAQLPLSHKLWAWFESNRKQALTTAVVLVVLGMIAGYVLWRQSEKEIAAGEALSDVELPELSNASAKPQPADAYLKVAANYPKSIAGARALLLAASSFFMDGKYAEAKTQFERFARDYRTSPFMGQALLGVAASLDAQGKTNEAITAYKNLVDHHPTENVVPQAKFALARLYEATNKPEQARAYFEELNRAQPYGSLGSEAGIRLEELLAKYPNLAPKPLAPPSTQLPKALMPPPSISNVAAEVSQPGPAATNAVPPVPKPATTVSNLTPPTSSSAPSSAPKP